MARLNETQIVIKISKLQKDTDEDDILLTPETTIQLETIIAELVEKNVLVEITNINK